MKAAIVTEFGKPPAYGDFEDPSAGGDEVLVTVTAAALSPLTRIRAAGQHYSSTSAPPFVPGVDGVGRMANGDRVYFAVPKYPYGGMAEKTLLNRHLCVPLPDALDDVTAAAIGNPGMSSWAALKARAGLSAGEVVLVNGGTGTAGQLAVQIAKCLGAAKVIATGRNAAVLEGLAALGADVTLSLQQPARELEEAVQQQFTAGVDIVVDYLWGSSAELLIAAAASGRPDRRVRFVQVGSMSGAAISLPGAALRSTGLELMGSGLGSVPMDRLIGLIGELMQAAVPAGLKIAAETFPLAAVEETWSKELGHRRAVFTMN